MGISEEFNSIEFDDDIDYGYVREYLDLIGFNLCAQKGETITTACKANSTTNPKNNTRKTPTKEACSL